MLVTTDDQFVCVTPDGDDGPTWSYQAAARIAGVRNTRAGIVVVDVNGKLVNLQRDNGKVLDQIDLGVAPISLSATEEGQWAVAHAKGICLGQRGNSRGKLSSSDEVTCACLDEKGGRACMGTQSGNVTAFDLATGQGKCLRFGKPITGLAWGRLGFWVVVTTHQAYRADDRLSESHKLIKSDNFMTGAAVSPDGCLSAIRVGRHQIVVVGPEGDQVGAVYYPERLVGEFEFGPFPWLGVGIGQGDGNRISILDENIIYPAIRI